MQIHYIELVGTVFGFFYIYFEIKEKIWLWPIGLLTSLLYIVVFYNAKIYADMGLQFYYVGVSIYGWYWWIYAKKKNEKKLPIIRLQRKTGLILALLSVLFFIIISQFLKYYTDSPIPYIDALTTSLSITATWMLARKYLEQWYIWIFVNAVSAGVYIYRDLYITVTLFIAYFLLAIVGLEQWKRNEKVASVQTK